MTRRVCIKTRDGQALPAVRVRGGWLAGARLYREGEARECDPRALFYEGATVRVHQRLTNFVRREEQ
jgi:hypothetical protein